MKTIRPMISLFVMKSIQIKDLLGSDHKKLDRDDLLGYQSDQYVLSIINHHIAGK
jgi:hypothetical protein